MLTTFGLAMMPSTVAASQAVSEVGIWHRVAIKGKVTENRLEPFCQLVFGSHCSLITPLCVYVCVRVCQSVCARSVRAKNCC